MALHTSDAESVGAGSFARSDLVRVRVRGRGRVVRRVTNPNPNPNPNPNLYVAVRRPAFHRDEPLLEPRVVGVVP